MNLHRLGEQIQALVRRTAVTHDISLRRGATTVGPFPASSGPIGHELITDTGLDISDQNRDFYFEAEYISPLGQPKIGDVIIDHQDNSEWRLLPQNQDYAWRWHGQMRSAYHVITRQDPT